MKKIIIGIHGLSNKPEKELLQGWWELALREGLGRRRRLPFELVYWAHHYYDKPLDPEERDPESQLFLSEPYLPASGAAPRRGSRELRRTALQVLEKVLDWTFVSRRDPFRRYNFEELLLKKRFPELEAYFKAGVFREAVQGELVRTLARHRRHRIMLIGHSMGSVIGYDVLAREDVCGVDIFVTVGSPLGIPVILKRTVSRQAGKKGGLYGIAPESIRTAWWNFSDLQDKVALNYNLEDDILPNTRGIAPRDVEVSNDYTSPQGENRHKVYGYLRAPELARVVADFLAAEPGLWQRAATGVRRFFRRLGWTKK